MHHSKVIRVILIALATVIGAWLAVALLLPVVLPFLVALVIAAAGQPVVRLLESRGRLPRWLAAGSTVLSIFVLLGLAVYGLCRGVCGELVRLGQELPELLASLEAPAARLRDRLRTLTERAPDFLEDTLRDSIDNFFKNGAGLAERGYEKLFSLVSGFVAALPDLFLFLVTTVLASFMIASRYDDIRAWLIRQIPAKWKNRWETVVLSLRSALAAWIKAQAKLVGVNYLLLTMGLMLLNVRYPLLFGGLIALIDALPVFGTGAVLLPWSVLSFLRGDTRMGLGLVLLYGAAYLVRSVLELRLVGKQMGVPPLLTLLALYVGYRVMGVAGMILFPMGTVLVKQLWVHTVPGVRRGEAKNAAKKAQNPVDKPESTGYN